VSERSPVTRERKPSGILLAVVLLAGLLLYVVSPLGYRPDRPLAPIAPGSSSGPAFVVQILRPRAGLPLGGILPPRLFGIDEELGFTSTSAGASIGPVDARRIELGADGWQLVLVLDADGRPSPETRVEFELVFEERRRRVRCRPADPAVGSLDVSVLPGSDELGGRFDIELARCEDAETEKPLGWPPRPLVLHGSFDRLRPDATGAHSSSVRR